MSTQSIVATESQPSTRRIDGIEDQPATHL